MKAMSGCGGDFKISSKSDIHDAYRVLAHWMKHVEKVWNYRRLGWKYFQIFAKHQIEFWEKKVKEKPTVHAFFY